MQCFPLAAPNIAQYEWGSFVTRFNLAPFDKSKFRSILQGLGSGSTSWESSAQLRAHVGFLHELVHYLQDVATGVGHWDDYTRRNHLGSLFRWAVTMSELGYGHGDLNESGLSSAVRSDQNRLIENLLFVPTERTPADLLLRLSRALANANDGQPLPPNEIRALTLESILEGEAVATVFVQIAALKGSVERMGIVHENTDLLVPTTPDGKYTGSIGTVNAIFMHMFGGRPEPEQTGGWLRMILSFAAYLFDLALAHPSPKHLERLEASRDDYLPGVKLLRLLRAIASMDESAFSSFCSNVLAGKNRDAEILLLSECSYRYPETRDIYEGWATFWRDTSNLQQEDDAIASFRANVSTQRAKEPSRWRWKSFESIFLNDLAAPPIWTAEETYMMWGNRELRNPSGYGDRLTDASDTLAMWRTVDLFFDGRPLVCPHARLCKATMPVCTTGIADLRILPATDSCRLRGLLGFNRIKIGSNPMRMTLNDIDILTSNSARRLADQGETSGDSALGLTGIEVLTFLAGKIVVPVLCACARDALYKAWKHIGTKADLEAAKKAVSGETVYSQMAVPVETVAADLVEELRAEGVSREKAERVVALTISEVRGKIAKATSTTA